MIGAEREHHGEREEPCQNRKENRSEKIRDRASRPEQTELRGMIRLEQSGVKTSREKRGRSEQR